MIVAVVLAVCGAMLGHSLSLAADMDTRIRKVEQNDAANAQRFDAIKNTLEKLERQLERQNKGG